MRTIRIKVYKFEELSDKAKQKALDHYRSRGYDDGHGAEIIDSVKALCKIFELETGRRYSDLQWDHLGSDILELKGTRLATYIWNNYKSDLFKGKYYGKLVDTFKDGTTIPVSKAHPIGKRHVKRYSKIILDNCCVLTGMCWDDDILEPVYNFLECPDKSTTLEDLFRDIEFAIGKAFEDDEDWVNSDEYITDIFEGNDYEFKEDGTIY